MSSITNNSTYSTRSVNPLTGYADRPAPDTTPLPAVAEVDCLLIEMRQAGVITYRETEMARTLLASQLNGARTAAERAVIVDHWVAQLKAFGQFGVR